MQLQKACALQGSAEVPAGCSGSTALSTGKCSWSHHTGTPEPGPEVGVAKNFGMPYVSPVEIEKLPVYVEVEVLSSSVNSGNNKRTEEGCLMTDFYMPGLRKCKY